MADIIGVKFKPGGKLYYFRPNDEYLLQGTKVIVETARGVECGEVVMERRTIPDEQITHELKSVLRAATADDLRQVEENHAKEEAAFGICEQKIAAHKLDMKLVSVEYAFDGSKILFCFTADGRVDFRELVKDLASVFRTRIELRQIGVRDEAKMLGGLGICGRPFCCASFMGDFQPVSIKMAKEQGLSLNPVKISGTCGRLMCCLKYEEEAYLDLLRHTPRVGSQVSTPEGNGTIVDVHLLTGMLRVRMDDTPDGAPQSFHKKQVRVRGKGGENYHPEPEELLDAENMAALAALENEDGDSGERSRPQRRNDRNNRNNQRSDNARPRRNPDAQPDTAKADEAAEPDAETALFPAVEVEHATDAPAPNTGADAPAASGEQNRDRRNGGQNRNYNNRSSRNNQNRRNNYNNQNGGKGGQSAQSGQNRGNYQNRNGNNAQGGENNGQNRPNNQNNRNNQNRNQNYNNRGNQNGGRPQQNNRQQNNRPNGGNRNNQNGGRPQQNNRQQNNRPKPQNQGGGHEQ